MRIQGELQEQIMAVLWRIGSGNVEQVRKALPARYRGAYTTIQTVLNRLAERGLLARDRSGSVIVYAPLLTEAEYVSQELRRTLDAASAAARQTALAQLVGELGEGDASELRRLEREAQRKRNG
jgi:predicted transcriptional regulator